MISFWRELSLGDKIYACVPILVVVGAVFFIIEMNKIQNEALERAKLRNAFMAECIERHAAKRCGEFWQYGRTDLGR